MQRSLVYYQQKKLKAEKEHNVNMNSKSYCIYFTKLLSRLVSV